MGSSSSAIGSTGAGLFQHLVVHWDAIFTGTGDTPHTDGQVYWPDLPGARMTVQIKSTRKPIGLKRFFSVPVSSSNLRDWAEQRPVLVVCSIPEQRCWWISTVDCHLPRDARGRPRLRVPLVRPVDASTKQDAKRATLRRSHYHAPFVHPPAVRSVADFSPGGVTELLVETMSKGRSASIIDRDADALALARMVYLTRIKLTQGSLDRYLERIIDRLFASPRAGDPSCWGRWEPYYAPAKA